MVECTALEMRHTCKGIGGSNPSLSAILSIHCANLERDAPPGDVKLALFIPTRSLVLVCEAGLRLAGYSYRHGTGLN